MRIVGSGNTVDRNVLYEKDGDGDANGLLKFPILGRADITGGQLILTGFARPGPAIELFIAAPDPTGLGEGRT